MAPRRSRFGPDARRLATGPLGAAALLAAAVVAASWPLAAHLGHAFVAARGSRAAMAPWVRADTDLIAWILAWDAHALLRQPLHLFQANIFHPAPDALASSEHLLGLAPIAAPVFWLTGDAVLAYDVCLLAVVWLTAFTTFLLIRSWSGSAAAGLLAAAAFALGPACAAGFARLHWSAVSLFPALLLLAHRCAARPNAGRWIGLAALTAIQALAGMYVAYELAVLVAFLAAALVAEGRQGTARPWPALTAIATGWLVASPVALPYLRARAAGRLAEGTAVLSLPGVGSHLALGAVASDLLASAPLPLLALAVLAVLRSPSAERPRRLALAGAAVAGVLLALGPAAPLLPFTRMPGLYRIAMELVPGFAQIRAPSRFLILPAFAASVLGALAAADLARATGRWIAPRAPRIAYAALAFAAGALLWQRSAGAPVPIEPVDLGGPAFAADRWLRDHGDERAVLVLPAARTALDFRELALTGRAMLGSTLHWQPLVNGYSGHPPPSAPLLATIASRLPDPRAFADLCALTRIGWIVLHTRLLGPRRVRPWERAFDALPIEVAARLDDVSVLRVQRRCGALVGRLREEVRRGPGAETLGGHALAPLPARSRRAAAVLEAPRALVAGVQIWLRARVRNLSATTWPGLTTDAARRLGVRLRWTPLEGDAETRVGRATPLATDLEPGEEVTLEVGGFAPPPGRYRVALEVVQGESGPPFAVEAGAPTAVVRTARWGGLSSAAAGSRRALRRSAPVAGTSFRPGSPRAGRGRRSGKRAPAGG